MTELDAIKERFSNDRFATEAAGARIEAASEGYARCALEVAPIHRNAMGNVMGGVIYTLADFAFAVASNYTECGAVSLTCQITYTSPVRGGTLIAEARCKKNGRSTCFYIVDVADELGTPVATLTATGFNTRPQAQRR